MMKKINKKVLVMLSIIAICVVAMIVGVFFLNGKNTQDSQTKVETIVKQELVLETGSQIPALEDYFESINGNLKGFQITYLNEDESVEDRNILITTTYYEECEGEGEEKSCKETVLSPKAQEAILSNDEEAILEIFGDKTEEMQEIEFTTVVSGAYSYEISISDGKTTYNTKLVIKDETKPVLKVKDVEITEGEEVSASMFFVSCEDNSRTACDALKSVNEEGEEATLPKEVGEHEVYFQSKDASGNASEVVKATLKINKKPEEPKKESSSSSSSSSSNSGSNSSSSNKGSSSSSGNSGSSSSKGSGSSSGSSGSSSGSSGGSSGGSSSKPSTPSTPSKPACGANGFLGEDREKVTQAMMYEYWGCSGSGKTYGRDVGWYQNASLNDVRACDEKFGSCWNTYGFRVVYDANNFRSVNVGVYFQVKMYTGNYELVGEGYNKGGATIWQWKKF